MKKKVFYIILLVLFIVAIIAFFALNKGQKTQENNQNNTQVLGTRNSNENEIENTNTEIVQEEVENEQTQDKKTIVTKLDDGTLYSFTEETEKANIIIGDNYYDTQINDIMLNFKNYKGKTIEIEGMYLDSSPYTFVGRYSTSNICIYCPQGYSYFEYVWDGDKIDVENEVTWLKIIGKLCVGNDETTNFQDYYYIQASSVEIMNESGKKTVNN